MDAFIVLAPIVFWALFWGAIGNLVGQRRGIGQAWSFAVSAILGPIGVLIVAVVRTGDAEKQRLGLKKCPECAEWVQRTAKVCKHCGYRGQLADS